MYIVDNLPHYPAIFLHMIHTLQEFLDHRLVIYPMELSKTKFCKFKLCNLYLAEITTY